jgi:S-formylglutathione hydrolase
MWKSEIIGGIDLEIFEPASPRAEGGLLLFRGRQPVRWESNLECTRRFSEAGLVVLAPHRGEGWWFDRARIDQPNTRSDMQQLVADVIPLFETRWRIAPPGIALIGIESGGSAAFGLAYRHARRFPIVAAIQPAIDFHLLAGRGGEVDAFFDSPEAARQQTAPLHVHPLDWPKKQWLATHPDDAWHDGCERLLSKLDSIGIPCERVIDGSAPTAAEFASQQLGPAVEFVSQALKSL